MHVPVLCGETMEGLCPLHQGSALDPAGTLPLHQGSALDPIPEMAIHITQTMFR